jgi:hypothetical protein
MTMLLKGNSQTIPAHGSRVLDLGDPTASDEALAKAITKALAEIEAVFSRNEKLIVAQRAVKEVDSSLVKAS